MRQTFNAVVYTLDGESKEKAVITEKANEGHLLKIENKIWKIQHVMHTQSGIEFVVTEWQFSHGDYGL